MPESVSYDLFISYSRRDNGQGRVGELVTLIEKEYRDFTGGDELGIFFDTSGIKGMEDWRHRILGAIRSTRLLLVCLSPNYLQSEYCAWEVNEYLKHEATRSMLGEGIAPIYFVEIPAWGNQEFKQRAAEWVIELQRRERFDFRPWFDEGATALREAAVSALLGDLSSQIRQRLNRIGRVLEAKGNVDRHNEHFVGRAAELRRLREMVDLDKVGIITAVHGLGGMGKTALAVEYAHAFAHDYPGGRWQVRCEGREDLRAALVSLAGARDLEFEFSEAEKQDLALGFERVLAELKKRAASANPPRVLVLLDNVDQPKLLNPAQVQQLPQAEWFSIIATTRLGEHDLFGSQKDRAFLAVDELPEGEALGLIEQYQPSGKFPDESARIAARDIVTLLGRLTLAVEIAAVYLGQFSEVSCGAFRERLRREGLIGLEGAAQETTVGVRHAEKKLSATLRPTLERLGKAEWLTLTLAALLPADHVALPWLRSVAAEAFAELGNDAEPGYPDPWLSVLRRLYSLRILQATAEPNEARMHRLLQELLKSEVTLEALESWDRKLLQYIKTRAEFMVEGWVIHENHWEIGPLAACSWQWMEHEIEEGASLANLAAALLQRLGKFVEAESLIRRALAIQEASLGPDHPGVATALTNLALLLQATNRLSEAEPLMRRALAIQEASFGSDNPDIATGLSNLALLLQATNRLSEAEPLMRRALAIHEANLGPNHPDVATSLSNLAQFLQATNRMSEAEPLMRRALAIHEACLGLHHPRVATDLNNLTVLLQATNRLLEAEPLIRRALAIDEASLGPDHPDVAILLTTLAQLLQATNRLLEAEPLMRRALAIDEMSLGPDHPGVAIGLNNLAVLLQATNRMSDAEPLILRALAIDELSLGPDHPHVARDLNNLAMFLLDANRFSEAEPLMLRALAIDEVSFGPDHPDVARDCNNLARLFQAANRFSEAEPLMRRALAIDNLSLGPDHPRVAIALSNLAQLLEDTNRLSEAEPLYRRALAINEASLGRDHHSVAILLNTLAQLLQATNRLSEAEPLMRRALAIEETRVGPDNPIVAVLLCNLVGLLRNTNRLTEAEALYRRVLAIEEASFGPSHPNVAIDLDDLAQLLKATNRLSEVEPLVRRALAIREEAFGPDHLTVAMNLNDLMIFYNEQGQYGKAEPLSLRALAIWEKALGPNHHTVVTGLKSRAILLRKLGRPKEASALEVRVRAIQSKPNSAFRDFFRRFF